MSIGRSAGFPLFIGLSALWAASTVGCTSSDNNESTGTGGQAATGTGGASAANGGGSATGGSVPISVKGQACSRATKVGGFWVEGTASTTSAAGYVEDAVTPAFVWKEAAREGDCAILQRPTLFCATACTSDQVCSTNGSCVAAPKKKNVGTVTISGLSTSVSMTPDNLNDYGFQPTIPHPGFSAGSAISLTASGADLGPFSLSAQGVAGLTVTSGSILITRGSPLDVTWTPPAQAGNGRIWLTLNLSSHGTDSVALECNVADTGSFQLPASLISQLMTIETAGYPKLTVARQTADSTTVGTGCVDLVVKSTVIRDDVTISGVTFCPNPGETADCPSGMTCLESLICGNG